MDIIVIGVDNKTAPMEIVEKVSRSRGSLEEYLIRVHSLASIRENMILSTCNRMEVYAAVSNADEGIHELKDFLSEFYGITRNALERFLCIHRGEQAVRHIFRVASSLDSMVAGEPQILGQVGSAFDEASRCGTLATVLNQLLTQALAVAKRVHTETKIDNRDTSIILLVVELTQKIFADLRGKAVLVLGTGEICELATEHLMAQGVSRVMVANQTVQQARKLAQKFDGDVVRFGELAKALGETDIVISSTTSPHYVIDYSKVANAIRARRNRSMFFVDVALSRDIDPLVNSIENIYLYDIVDLQEIVDKRECDKAEHMVEREVTTFCQWCRSLETPTVAPSKSPEATGRKELGGAYSAPSRPLEAERRLVDALTAAIVKTLHRLVVGTRGSKLALWQAEWIKARLMEAYSGMRVELRPIKTSGDMILDIPLTKVGGKGLFVKEIEKALLDGRVDLAVHSMKDLPIELPPGLSISCVPKREDPRDALISKRNERLKDLPAKARIGSSSLRRRAQILRFRSDLEIVPLRGNLDTRIRKLETQELDAIILAAAGLRRMGLSDWITEILPTDICLPAIGQGALAIETRLEDPEIHERIAFLNDPESVLTTLAERAFLKRLEGGCQVPLAAHARVIDGDIRIEGMVASVDGKEMIREFKSGKSEDAERLGIELAETILSLGADRILRDIYEGSR